MGNPFPPPPPLGHNCRCGLIQLDADEAEIRSRDGRGLNQPETPDMQADDAGWGRKPTEWSETLAKVERAKLAKAPSEIVAQYAARIPSPAMLPRGLPHHEYLAAFERAVGGFGVRDMFGAPTESL